MILASLLFLLLGCIAFVILKNKAIWIRLGIAAMVWLIPTAGLFAWVISVGDKAMPGSVTIVPAPTDSQ